ncbi:bacterial Ig-like domain-containing protein, partial [Vibrio sp. FNV 38]|nr:bacterial Ig-like domain-containing protein [Vibrio sp. FNV 38]
DNNTSEVLAADAYTLEGFESTVGEHIITVTYGEKTDTFTVTVVKKVIPGDIDGDGAADMYIFTDATNIVWTATANGNGFNLTNGSDYLEGKSGNVRIYNAQQYGDRYWTYSGNQLQHVGGTNTYTVYYSNNNFTSA